MWTPPNHRSGGARESQSTSPARPALRSGEPILVEALLLARRPAAIPPALPPLPPVDRCAWFQPPLFPPRGTRPRALRDHRRNSAYLSGAVCPERGIGAAVVLPHVNVEAMTIHLAEISRNVTRGAHAVLVLDQAGWHTSPKPMCPRISACCRYRPTRLN